MNAAVTRLPLTNLSLRCVYRRLLAVPVRTRLAVGFAGPVAAVGLCAVVAALLPATTLRPTAALGVLAWVLAVSVVSDLLWRRIFNWVLGPALVAVAGLHAVAQTGVSVGLPTVGTSAAGLAVCFGLMLVLYATFRGGEGDVKLVAVLGAVLGPWHGVEAAVAGYLLAAVAACGLVVVRIAHRAAARPPAPRPILAGTLPMAPFFAAGVVFTLAC